MLKPASTLAAVTTVGSITNALPTGLNTLGAVATVDGFKTTYSASIVGLASAASATDMTFMKLLPVDRRQFEGTP